MAIATHEADIRLIRLLEIILAFKGNHTTRNLSIPIKMTNHDDEIFVPRKIRKNTLQPKLLIALTSIFNNCLAVDLENGNTSIKVMSESASAVRYTPVEDC